MWPTTYSRPHAIAFLLVIAHEAWPMAADAQTRIRIGTCARTLTAGVGSPFAVAAKLGYFAHEGLNVEVVPLTGSTDCVTFVAVWTRPIS
jgi:NitT/TauT family transport system substrate-binding protein